MPQSQGLLSCAATSTVTSLLILSTSVATDGLLTAPAIAQSIRVPEGSGTTVTLDPDTNTYRITGDTRSRDGVNLFHDLTQLGLNRDEIANFIAQDGVGNILTRVTGGDVSIINGLIQVLDLDDAASSANLFLMNPAGLVFGENASLNVAGDFTATTAVGIGFDDGWFSATGENDYGTLTGMPNRFAFGLTTGRNGDGAIINAGELEAGNDLSLLGGSVVNIGSLQASSDIVVASIPGENLVQIRQPGNLLSLEVSPIAAPKDSDSSSNDRPPDAPSSGDLPNFWTLPILSLPELLTGGAVSRATNIVTNPADDAIALDSLDSGTTIVSGEVVATEGKGGAGGTVQILGEDIYLIDTVIDASGGTNGGTVLIGGDLDAPDRLPFANSITAGGTRSASIAADSLDNGNGGRIEFAVAPDRSSDSGSTDPDDKTASPSNGLETVTLSAEGGLQGGDGGIIRSNREVFVSSLSVAAPAGKSTRPILVTVRRAGDRLVVPITISLPIIVQVVDEDGFPLIPNPPIVLPPNPVIDPVPSPDVIPPLTPSPVITPSPTPGVPPAPNPPTVMPIPNPTFSPVIAAPVVVPPSSAPVIPSPSIDVGGIPTPQPTLPPPSISAPTPSVPPSPTVVSPVTIGAPNSTPVISPVATQVATTTEGDDDVKSEPGVSSDAAPQESSRLFADCYGRFLEFNVPNSQGLPLDEAIALGTRCFELGYYPQAEVLYQSAFHTLKDTNDTPLKAFLRGHLGNLALVTGNYQGAIDQYQDQLKLAEAIAPAEAGNRAAPDGATQGQLKSRIKTTAMVNLGNVYLGLHQYEKAVDFHKNALTEARSLDDKALETSILSSLGISSLLVSDFPQAIAYQEQALKQFRDLDNRQGEAGALINLGLIDFSKGEFSQAVARYQEALTIAKTTSSRSTEASAWGNLGNVYQLLGNYYNATDALQQQLELARTIGDRQQEANALGSLASVYHSTEDYQMALDLLAKQSFIVEDIGDRAGEAYALNNLGETYRELGQLQQAQPSYEKALELFTSIGNRQAKAMVMGNLGLLNAAIDEPDQALDYHKKALALKRQVGDREGERLTLSEMGDVLAAQDRTELAIVFYKQSVNLSETIRQDLKALPLEFQQSYADEIVADTYRSLADLLLQQDRVLEAQQVMDLLKVQELEDYLGQVRGNAQTAVGVDYHQPEQRILDLYDRAIALGQELDTLRQIPGSDRTPAQQERLEELTVIEQDLLASFFDFVDSPEIIDLVDQLSRTARRQNLDPGQLNALRDNLQNLEQNAVLLYPLILEDRLELILVTPYSPPIRRTVPVSRRVFNQTILDFRQELTNPVGRSFSSARQLHKWLIEPLEADLAAANAETIVYAPDGQLRYIPLTALNDGDQWLIEKYRVNHITSASLTDFNTVSTKAPQVLAAAFSDADNEYSFDVGQRSFSFGGLPYAGLEVELIANKIPATTSLFDQDFTRAQTVPKMNDHTIVHLATHAEFVPGTPEESFILFGDGDRATLRDVATWSLQNVDLVVLSACKTAVGGEFGNGEEILGFGYQLQRTGARAAIASLWSVDDGGTQLLMNLFYEALNDPTLTKAEALQQAQIAMLNGDLSDLIESRPELAELADSYQHPRYWSSFILIGNGL